ncbi:hypothetical protein BDW71DRAFT_83984 [Aspergillus fruticulosus]
MAEFLLSKGADVNLQDGYCRNALSAAALVGNAKIVGMLLDRGADINGPGAEGHKSVLQTALSGRHDGVVALLRRRGAKEQ